MFHSSTLRWRKNLTITAILCFFTGIGTTQKFSDRVLERSHVPIHAAVRLSRSEAKSGLHGRLQRDCRSAI